MSDFVFLLAMVKIQLFYFITFFLTFKYLVRRGTLSFYKNVKIQQNSAFQTKWKGVVEKNCAEKHPLTYLGNQKSNLSPRQFCSW